MTVSVSVFFHKVLFLFVCFLISAIFTSRSPDNFHLSSYTRHPCYICHGHYTGVCLRMTSLCYVKAMPAATSPTSPPIPSDNDGDNCGGYDVVKAILSSAPDDGRGGTSVVAAAAAAAAAAAVQRRAAAGGGGGGSGPWPFRMTDGGARGRDNGPRWADRRPRRHNQRERVPSLPPNPTRCASLQPPSGALPPTSARQDHARPVVQPTSTLI